MSHLKHYSTRPKCSLSFHISRETPVSPNQHIFIEDLCQRFSLDLAESKDDELFFDISPAESPLKDILTYDNYDFLKYEMDKLLSDIMHALILYGKAFIEVVTSTDDKNKLLGISLVPFQPTIYLPSVKHTRFVTMENKRIRVLKICNRNLVIFYLHDLGLSRNSLKRIYRALPRLDVLSSGDMSLSPKKTGFDFSLWNNKREYKILKLSKKTGWYGRNTSNPYMSEAYLLYRIIKLKVFRKKFLDYFLNEINESVHELCREYEISGTIIAKSIQHNYDELLQKLDSGEINFSQLGKYVF